MLKELPIIVMWNQAQQLFHLKYMMNAKYKIISGLVFTIGNESGPDFKITQDEYKRLVNSSVFMKVEKDQKLIKLWVANLKNPQGIIEFQTPTVFSQVTIEMMIKD